MDIISTLGNTISLAKRLKEISKNVSEAEFQNLLADLLNQLATIKVEIADLKDQLVALQEENKALKNKEVNEAESFSQLAKLLQNIKVTIPSSINNGEGETTNDFFSIFVNIQKQLVTGITNKAGEPKRTLWLYYEICPKLKVHGVVSLESIPGVEYQRFSISKTGEEFLHHIDKKKLK